MQTITKLFEAQARKEPGRIALTFGDRNISYQELNARANRIAFWLILKTALRPEEAVGVMLERGPGVVESILGILKAGGMYVPIETNLPPDRMRFIIEDTRMKAIITESGFATVIEDIQKTDGYPEYTLYMDSGLGDETVSKDPVIDISSSSAAYIIYTSGTTGTPKGVVIRHSNVLELFANCQPLFGFGEQDVWAMFHSYSFDFSVWEMYGALLYGGRLVLMSRDSARDVEVFLKLLKDEGVTILNQTPSAFYNLLREELKSAEDFLYLKMVIFGGEALSPGMLIPWKKKYPLIRLVNMFGITETTVHVTYKEITDVETDSNYSNIGRPLPGVDCYILDTRGQLVPNGVPGELYVGGWGVAKGYLNREEINREKFVGNVFKANEMLYRSGDLVRRQLNGDMIYVGRNDHQVKIRGHRVETGEIENALIGHPLVEDAMVIATTVRGDIVLVAYLIGGEHLTAIELKHFLSDILPEYMIPGYFARIERWPLTVNGKVDRNALPDVATSRIDAGTVYEAPRNEQETGLIRVFAEVLGLEVGTIGIRDNFFVLGGDSIKAIKTVGKIKQQLLGTLSLAHLYSHPTVGGLSDHFSLLTDGQDMDGLLQKGLAKIEKISETVKAEDARFGRLPSNYEAIYPLSPVEQGMIYSSLIRPGEPVYYDQIDYAATIPDPERFKTAVLHLIKRHSNLRTKYFIRSFSIPIKVILRQVNAPFDYEDIHSERDEIKETLINEYLRTDVEKRLEFDDELLWHLKVFRISESGYRIVLSFHHALLDGWSVSVFITELAMLLSGKGPLAELKYGYKDHCAILLGKGKDTSIEGYWRQLLKGYERNRLPFNFRGGRRFGHSGMRKLHRKFGEEVLQNVTSLTKLHQLSFKSICLTAHLWMLHILSTDTEVVTGVVCNDRPGIEGGEYILGCFLNTIPIRIDFEKERNVLQLLEEVEAFLVTSKPNEVHLSEIAGMIGDRAGSQNPIFDTLLNFTDFHSFENWQASAFAGDGTVARNDEGILNISEPNEMTNTLFDVEVDKTLGNFTVGIKYALAYFHEDEVRRALELYSRILGFFCTNVSAPLTDFDPVFEKVLAACPADFNTTEAFYQNGKTISQLLEVQVERSPDHIAIKQDGQGMTYLALNRRANWLARYLIRRGIGPGDNIGLLVERSFDMMTGLYGILKSGAAYVPLDPDYPLERIKYMLENSGITIVLTNVSDEKLSVACPDVEFIPMATLGSQPTSSLEQPETDEDNPPPRNTGYDLAYTIYTSGSTGRPKGVMINHHSVVNLIEWVNEQYQVGLKDRLLFVTSICFDLSVYDIFGILSCGGTIVIARQEEVQHVDSLLRLLKEERISFWNSVPSTMNYLVGELETSNIDYCQRELRVIFLSGDWIPVELPKRIKRCFPFAEVVSLGGATEATVWSNFFSVGEVGEWWTSIPYGRPIKNNFFYILDKKGRPVPQGIAGELYIGGVGVAKGYSGEPEKTAWSFRPDPFNDRLGGRMYRTGDLGRLMPDGNMEFLGRLDNQIKIRGFRVEAGEIESLLSRHEKITDAIVEVKGRGTSDARLCAYLVLAENMEKEEIHNHLRKSLPSYMIPDYYVFLDAFPLTVNGKIDRRALPDPQPEAIEIEEFVVPKTPLQVELAGMLRSLLSVATIGIKDDIFRLGANSLTVGALVNRIHKKMGIAFDLKEVFMNPTIEAIAEEIEKTMWVSKQLCVADDDKTENYIL